MPPPNVLFLTTAPTDNLTKYGPYLNLALRDELAGRGIATTIQSWRDTQHTSTDALSKYTHIIFLSCLGYIHHIHAFDDFLEARCTPAQSRNPAPQFLNPPAVVRWNSNKLYLNDLQAAGFLIPPTMFLSTFQPIDYVKFALARRTSNEPVIIKPSVSADGIGVHLVRDPQALTDADDKYLSSVAAQRLPGSIMLQDFLPTVRSGEYSLVFIGGRFRYAYVTTPTKEGDLVFEGGLGGKASFVEVADVPASALESGTRIVEFVTEKFQLSQGLPYARVDGVLNGEGRFTLMEIELIEPELALDRDSGKHDGLGDLCTLILG